MFSVQQKRDISAAVQKILRDTNHAELPTSGEISFNLKVVGAESWSYAEIMNNAAVGDPGVNPHNELMASLPEEAARDLIEKAQSHQVKETIGDAAMPPYVPDPRATPEEFYKEMLTTTLAKLQRDVSRLNDRDRIKDTLYSELSTQIDKLDNFITPIIEDNLILYHSEQIRELRDSLDKLRENS
jgi:hypothetical protein